MRHNHIRLLALSSTVSLSVHFSFACSTAIERPARAKSEPAVASNSGNSETSTSEQPPVNEGTIETPSEPEKSTAVLNEERTLKAFKDPGVDAPEKDPKLATLVHKYFNIHVVDRANNQGIAGVTLTTVNNIRLTSDKNGFVAFYEPGLMANKVYFNVKHPGFEVKKDVFGFSGAALDISEGGSAFIYLDKTTGQTIAVNHEKDSFKILGQKLPLPSEIFGLRIVDKVSKRGVPLVRVVNAEGEEFWSDNQGFVAFDDTTLIGKNLNLKLSSDGYESSEASLTASKGQVETLEITRRNIAERLYRSTGAGSYRDSVLLGFKTPVAKPHVDGLVSGQDTLNAIIYKSKIFWIWQDTGRISYMLGNFGNSGAIADLPSKGNISQDLGINRTYFVDNEGFSRPMTPNFEPTSAPTWMGSLVALPNAAGEEKMYGQYGKATGHADIGKRGWGVYDDASNTFKDVIHFAKAEYLPGQILTPWGDPEKVNHAGKDYLYFGAMRVPATVEALLNIDAYETYSPYSPKTKTLLRNADGSLAYQWQKNAYPVVLDELQKAGVAPEDILHEMSFRDKNGDSVVLAAGTLEKNWNSFRKRYIGTIQQKLGTSLLGESWIAEADTPIGPWNFATKIISHDRYTFYNLQQHPFYDREGGRLIYVHGTYTNFFTSEPATPRYDYNQVLYRIDLADPRMQMPVAIYDLSDDEKGQFASKRDLHEGSKALAAKFYAYEKASSTALSKDLIALSWSAPECSKFRRLVASEGMPSVFYLQSPQSPATPVTEELYEFRNSDGHYAYSRSQAMKGYTREALPLGRVWKSFSTVKVPVGEYLGNLLAHAGEDQCLEASGDTAKLSLNARKSNGRIKEYSWILLSKTLRKSFQGPSVEIELPRGVYHVELQVSSEDGETHTDRSMVEIR